MVAGLPFLSETNFKHSRWVGLSTSLTSAAKLLALLDIMMQIKAPHFSEILLKHLTNFGRGTMPPVLQCHWSMLATKQLKYFNRTVKH